MTTTRIFLLLLPVLVTSCRGGSNGSATPIVQGTETQSPLSISAASVEMPTAPVETPAPNDAPVTDIDAGGLSQLCGRGIFGYAFTGTEVAFIVDTVFSPSNLIDAPGGVILASTTRTAFRVTSESEFILAGEREIRCDAIE